MKHTRDHPAHGCHAGQGERSEPLIRYPEPKGTAGDALARLDPASGAG
ncbi:hypothetical protein [Pseudovibrio exalbescens]|nr:hypothetical protein [Pseudovibrio exalbescens]